METTRLGRTGLNVSRLALGGMNFGSEIDEPQVHAILDRAAEIGLSFIDTANAYPIPLKPEHWGVSEEIVGRWLKGKREQVVLATKCGIRVGHAANDAGGSRKHIIEACDNSLRRLGTDRVDVYYLHLPELNAPIDETFEALDRLVRAGKIHYFGLSNFHPWQIALAMETIADLGLSKIAVIQDRYSLVARGPERDVFPLARAKEMGLVVYNPLGGGILAGMLERGDKPPDVGRFTMSLYQDRYLRDDVFDMADTMKAVGLEMGCSGAQVALAWILHQPGNIVPLIGALRPDHVTDCAKALELKLPAETIALLNRKSEIYR